MLRAGAVVGRILRPLVSGVYASERLQELVQAGLLTASSRLPYGTNVFERDWDLLVVLDTCRFDAMRAVAPEFEFVTEVGSIRSVGSATAEWAANTFVTRYREAIAETACVTANGTVQWALEGEDGSLERARFADRFTGWNTVTPDEFLSFDGVWEYGPRDPYGGIVIPEAVTDRAIAIGRDRDPDRLIAHYMPPHAPYRANPIRENRPMEPHEADPWAALRSGTPRETVWEAYLDDLWWVLESVGRLLANVDAETVAITADHGDSFGEFGVYAHPMGVPHPKLRRVPWVETTATDTGEHEPSIRAPDGEIVDRPPEDQLRKLGYL